jgi:hypothetical protein
VYQTAHRDKSAWNVKLPDCCVVCGGQPHGSVVMQTYRVHDLTGPLVGPLAGLAMGLLGWIVSGSPWWLPLLLILGTSVGYLLRRKTQVNIRLGRCREHRAIESVPEMISFAGSLSIRAGSPKVREEFIQQNRFDPRTATDEEKARRAAHEASLRGRTGRRLSDAASLALQLVAVAAVLAATPWVFKHSLVQFGQWIGWGISLSLVYLIVGAAVLKVCCRLFAGGTPDYPAAMFTVFLAAVVWNGVIGLLATTSPPQIPSDMQDLSLVLHAAAYIGGVTIFLFVVPSLLYVWLLDVSFGAAFLIFTLQHVVTFSIAVAVLLVSIRFF